MTRPQFHLAHCRPRAAVATVALVMTLVGGDARAQQVTVPSESASDLLWVAATDYALHSASDATGRIENYKTIVLAAGLDGFYKTYPHATPAQAQAMVESLKNRLNGVRIPDYVFGHQTQEDIVHSIFNIVGDGLNAPGLESAKLSLTVGREGYDMLNRELNALLDEQVKVASENAIDTGFRLSNNSAFLQKTLASLRARAKEDPAKAAFLDAHLTPRSGLPILADMDTVLRDAPAFAQAQSTQWIKAHMVTIGDLRRFEGDVSEFTTEARGLLRDLKSAVTDELLPMLQSMNDLQLRTYATLEGYVEAEAVRRQKQAEAEQAQQVHQLRLQAFQSGVYLLSQFAAVFDQRLGRTIDVLGSTAVQINQALSNFSVAASSVDTSALGGVFTGDQLGAVILAGNLVGASMQLATLFQDNPNPDQIILDQLTAIRQQIAELQTIMISRFDRIDSRLNDITASLDLVLRQLADISGDVRVIRTELFALHSQISRLEVEIHEWLSNSDRIPLKTAINFALGYQHRTGTALPRGDFLANESLFYTWATDVSKDTTRAGPQFSPEIPMAEQLNFPLSSIINYLAQAVSQFLGLPPIVPLGTRLVSPLDWLFTAGAYHTLLRENADYVTPGIEARLRDVSGTGKQLQAALNQLASRDLFLHAARGLLASYTSARDALKKAILGFRDAFIQTNLCKQGGPGCLPSGVDVWDLASTTSYRPSISVIHACNDDGYAHENVSLSVPNSDLFAAVPPALLHADQRSPGSISLCFHADFTSTASITGIRMIIRVLFRGRPTVNYTVIAGPTGRYTVCPYGSCGGPVSPYWFFQPPSQQQAQGWERERVEPGTGLRFTFKGQFEPHFTEHPCPSCPPPIQFSTEVLPWAQNLTPTALGAFREELYRSLADEFTKMGTPIGSNALLVSTRRQLVLHFIELGLPQTLRGNDYLRAALYGEQRIYTGYNPLDNRDLWTVYMSAGANTPEPDIEALTDPPLRVVRSVLEQVFDEIAAGRFSESNVQIERTIQKLDDLAAILASPEARTAVFSRIVPPRITLAPRNQTIASGSTAQLRVEADGTAPLIYQWYSGLSPDTTNPIAGATTDRYETPPLQQQSSLWVRVSNSRDYVNSETAVVSIGLPPVISLQPAAMTVIGSGQSAVLTVVATGAGQLTYEWFVGEPPSTSVPLSYATSSSLTTSLENWAPGTSASYWVRVSNEYGSINSTTAVVWSDHAITQVRPGRISAGGASFILTVTGAGFTPTMTVLWRTAFIPVDPGSSATYYGSSVRLPTTFVSSTELTAIVPASLFGGGTGGAHGHNAGAITINPDGLSARPPIWIEIVYPRVTLANPTSVFAGIDTTITIEGDAFVPTSIVWLSFLQTPKPDPRRGGIAGGQLTPLATTYVSPSRLEAAWPSDYPDLPESGSYWLFVSNCVEGVDIGHPRPGCYTDGSAAMLSVVPRPTITLPASTDGFLPDGRSGVAYSTTFIGVNGRPPYTWAAVGSDLPFGLTLSAEGVLTGIPLLRRTSLVQVMLTDANGLTAFASAGLAIGPIQASFPERVNAMVGSALFQLLQTNGGHTPLTWSVSSGQLPPGIELAAPWTTSFYGYQEAVLKGSPTSPGDYSIIIDILDKSGSSTSRGMSIVVSCQRIELGAAVFPAAVAGVAYTPVVLTQTGAVGTANFAVSSGSLPAGLTLTSSGIVSGMPAASGAFSFTATVTDRHGCTGSRGYVATGRFTDDLRSRESSIKAVHFTELRAQIDALRVRSGLALFAWTDPLLVPGMTVKVVHLTELRSALADVYAVARQAIPPLTDPTLSGGITLIRAAHLQELRDALVALETSLSEVQ